ncbi:MAG TPA: DUF1802 family protein [Pyrinomonadaceae bacterium]
MQANSNIAFKEWAIVVDALGLGEQILILRKGGIREQRSEFQVDHREFWLLPTQYHEAEGSIIPSKRPALREIAAAAVKDFVDVGCYAVVDTVIGITDPAMLSRVQGRHIWNEEILRERFRFGREPGLHALLTRVYRNPVSVRLPMRESYGGCRSWVELERSLSTEGLTPVLTEVEYNVQRDEICERLSDHALAAS